MSQPEFASQLGVNKNTIGNYERDQRLPDAHFLQSLQHEFNVSIDWVVTGRGAMHNDMDNSPERRDMLSLMEFKKTLEKFEEDFGAMIADSISRIYREEGGAIGPGQLWRLAARMFTEAMAHDRLEDRQSHVAKALADLRKELQKPVKPGETKRLA